MSRYVFPAEADYDKYREEPAELPHRFRPRPVIEELKLSQSPACGTVPPPGPVTNLYYTPSADLPGGVWEIAPEAPQLRANRHWATLRPLAPFRH